MHESSPKPHLLIEVLKPCGPEVIGTACSVENADKTVQVWLERTSQQKVHAFESWTENDASSPLDRSVVKHTRLGPVTLTLRTLPLGTSSIPHRYLVPGLPGEIVLEHHDRPLIVCGRDPDGLPYLGTFLDWEEEQIVETGRLQSTRTTWRVLHLPEAALKALLESERDVAALRAAAHTATYAYQIAWTWTPTTLDTPHLELLDDDLVQAAHTWDEVAPKTPAT